MEKFVYFASDRENFPEGARLALGFGFTPGGGWRPRPKPEAEALAADYLKWYRQFREREQA